MGPFPEHSLILWLGLGVLGLNAMGLLVLLLTRSAASRERVPVAPLCRACCAEVLGTFALVFFGSLAGIGSLEAGPLVPAALTHGLVLAGCVAALGTISGGHFNPAVTLGFFCSGRITFFAGLGYVLSQVGGAIGAAAVITWLFDQLTLADAVPTIDLTLVPLRAAFVLEAMATFVFVLVIFGTTRRPGPLSPVLIGGTLAAGILAIGAMTGGALNPARYLGPALLAGRLDAWLVYTVGPIVGAVLAAVFMHYYLIEANDASFIVQEPKTQEYEARRAA